MTHELEQLRAASDVVADIANVEAVRDFKPDSWMAKSSIILDALSKPAFNGAVAAAVEEGRSSGQAEAHIAAKLPMASDKLTEEIRKFHADGMRVETMLTDRLSAVSRI
ncbi:hypothetical protein GCM10007874_53960 [Labrys miyagiensis]|uniref:Uncharacterized protein n=1 Tax=Labrys miyagiensis TaxID=346912 RepID=A0ABQ6CPU8_9HYPH|nr:hypothetical protein [Labrys miyagiensis]GLS22378.1 hypothetical protein GCM10007874_53960 [Labrys miyagiensis]